MPKKYTNHAIAEFLTNIATAYQIKNKNRFEIAAYQNAADTVATFPHSLHDLWLSDPQKLDTVPNIGPGIIKKLNYFFSGQKLHPKLRPVFRHIHPSVFTLAKINGIGPKIAYQLTQHFRFPRDPQKSLEKLITYCQQHRLSQLPRFGPKSESSILQNSLSYLGRQNRLPLSTANKLAQKIIGYLHQKFPDVEFVPLGSLRRQTPTVGDIDLAAKSSSAKKIIDHFVAYPDTISIISRGPKKASIKIDHDRHLDLMVQPPRSFGSLLIHFTGSRQHNILLRRHALSLGYSLSEYGIKNIKTKKIFRFGNETDFYHFLHLAYIDPANRTGDKEIDTAKKCYTNSI